MTIFLRKTKSLFVDKNVVSIKTNHFCLLLTKTSRDYFLNKKYLSLIFFNSKNQNNKVNDVSNKKEVKLLYCILLAQNDLMEMG